MMKSSKKIMEVIESLVDSIHTECQQGRQRCLRNLMISLREAKEVFELLQRQGK